MADEIPEPYTEARRRAHRGAAMALWGVVLNALLAVAKIAGGVWGHSYALVADGIESILDIASSFMVWLGLRVAAEPPDDGHPFGHGKAEPLAALAVSLFIFGAAGWIGWHATHEIITPHRAPAPFTLVILVVVVVVKLGFSRWLSRADAELGSTALGAEALHHYSDALTSGAAFVGISIALLGGPGFEAADDWGALLACLVIAVNGVLLFRRSLGEMMDAAVPPELEEAVRHIALSVKGVDEVHKCRVRKSGLSHHVDIQVRVDGGLTVRRGHEIAHEVKDALLASPGHAVVDVSVHVEPMAE